MKKILFSLTLTIMLSAAAVLAHNPPAPAGPAPTDGKGLVAQRCSVCHSLSRVEEHQGKQPAAWWVTTVERMISKGAKLDQAQKRLVVKYLITGN